MSKIIWTKEELTNIKKILLNKTVFKINRDNDIILRDSNTIYSFDSLLHLPSSVEEELKKLYYIEDSIEISKILNTASLVIPDPKNNLHIGFISRISKVNPNNKEEIFIIFRELITLYNQVVYKVVRFLQDNTNNIDEMNSILESIKTSEEKTKYELLIQKEVSIVLSYANELEKYPIIESIVNELNNSIKNILEKKIIAIINTKRKHDEAYKNRDINNYYKELSTQIIKDKTRKGRKKIYY